MTKIGLALSGGGARGIAHLGVMQALDELGVQIDAISGTSAGAIMGAFYAADVAPKEVVEFIKSIKWLKFVRPAISKTGLLSVHKLKALFVRHLPVNSFQETTKSLTINATDISKGEIRYFNQGELIPAILASCCMPVIFDPMVIDGTAYMDGGVLNNLPVEPLKESCEVVIGSHCNPVDREFAITNAKTLLERTFLMAIRNNTLQRQELCDVFIEPPALGKYVGSDFNKADELFKIGYDYTLSRSKELLQVIN